MKIRTLSNLVAIAALWPLAAARADTYVITNLPGWNLIANQLDSPNGNGIRNVIPSAPAGSQLLRFNPTTKTFNPVETYNLTGSWQPGTNILNPGIGLYFSNAATANFPMTITGNPHVPVLPVPIGSGLALIARQTNDLGTFNNILGYNPPDFSVVYRFNPGSGRDPNLLAPPHYSIYSFRTATGWSPAPPTNRVGESWWVATNGSLPSVTVTPTNVLTCPGGQVAYTAKATGTLPLSYQWRLNGTNLTGAQASTYSIPSTVSNNAGDYTVVVANPFGSATSAVAKLTVLLPTSATGPSDTGGCPGSRVALQTTPAGTGPFRYQWTRNGTLLSGLNTNLIFVDPLGTGNSGTYCVVVTGSCGSVTNCATVSLLPSTAATPLTSVTNCPGTSATFATTAAGAGPFTYQWTKNGDILTGATTNFLALAPVAAGDQATYCVIVTGPCGAVTNCAFLAVLSGPPTIRCPADRVVAATAPEGAQVTFDVYAVDDCSKNVTVVCTPPSGSWFPIGANVVTCVATGAGGKQATCSFIIRVLAGSCCDSKVWSQGKAEGPTPRSGHALTGDVDGSGVLLFGGNDGTLRGDTWKWNGANWLLRASEGPAPREFTALAYDRARNVVVLFGGAGQGALGQLLLADTWEWNGVLWRQLQVSGPTARYSHAMAYDPNRHAVVLYGGANDGSADLQDTWEFNGTAWIQAPAGIPSPGPRAAHALGWDGAHVALFGGRNQGALRGDTWTWLGDRWRLVATNGPSARASHALAYDDYCSRLVLYGGGTSANSVSGDTWEWDGAAWNFKSDTDPTARWQHALAPDSARGQMVVFGGSRGTQGRLGDTWLRSGDQTPPHLVSVYGACNDTEVCLTFDEPISAATALNPANYTLACGPAPNTVLSIAQSDDGRLVCLTLADPIGSGCALVIQNLEDLCGNLLRLFQTGFECTQEPCPKGTAGTEFWLTFPGNYAPDPTNAPRPRLYVTGNPGTFVSVGAPGLTPPYSAWGNIPAGGELTFTLPRSADLGETNEVLQPKGIHVMAAGRVSVYGLNHVRFTSDAYLGLPKSILGKTYLVLSYQDAFASVPELNGSEFALVGTEDATTVIVVPAVDVGLHAAGLPFSLTLNRGQTWQLRNTNGLPADFTGSIVVADKPVALFAGHACANVPSGGYFFCDHLVEQMFPTEYWGKTFVTLPLAGRSGGDTFRVLALFNGTTVTTNGTAIPGSLSQGKFLEFRLATPSTLSASAPVLVAQYANSSDYDLVDLADPFMVLVLPTTLTSSKFVVQSPTSGFADNYINLYTTAAGVGAIQVGATTVPAGSYVNIAGSAWFGAKVAVTTGTHVVQSTNGVLFGATVYGWDLFDSYGYPAGFCNVPRDTQPPQFGCPPKTVSLPLGPDCTAEVPDLSGQVGNASAALMILQDPAAGSFVGPGLHTVTTTIIDRSGNRQVCTTVLSTSTAGLSCPGNLVAVSTSAQGAVVNYSVGLCDTNYTLTCVPPAGSLFVPGSTLVTCTATKAGVTERCTFTVQVSAFSLNLGVGISAGNVTVSWGGIGTLLTATSLTGPWQTLSNAPNPYVLPHTGKERFFRVRQ
jgi:hypothetical protein